MLCAELVGRDREVEVVRRVVAGTRHGDGRLITLVGGAGAGKSRLTLEATAAARNGGVAILAGRAVPGRTPVPYRALTRLAELAESDRADVARADERS